MSVIRRKFPGAISARGATEYDFNLRLAKVIERKLNDAGYARTSLLLATGPAIPSLVRRIAQANQMSADLLISIHHDSVPEAFKVKWEYEGKQLEYSDRFRGHSIFVSNDNADYQGSLAFGKLLGARLKARGLQYTPHYTQAFMGHKRRQLGRCRDRRLPLRSVADPEDHPHGLGAARGRLHRQSR